MTSDDAVQVPHPLGAWADNAACLHAEPDVFVPEQGDSCAAAREICADCPVAADCLDHAMNSPFVLHGVWGGTTDRQRQRMRRERKQRVS